MILSGRKKSQNKIQIRKRKQSHQKVNISAPSLVKIMNSRSLLTVAIFGLLLNFAVAEDEEGGAASSGKNEARLLVGKHVRENR